MKKILLATTFLLPAAVATAGSVEDGMKAYLESDVRGWFADPSVIAAVAAANATSGAMSADDIAKLYAQWQAEVGTDSALIKSVAESVGASYLKEKVAASGGKVTEIIVMDAKGLNVMISDVTSDYWQGDEDKYAMTFAVGADAVHLSEIELDESTQTYQAQISFTLIDPATGTPIGAVTVGLNAETF